jgi:predicted ATPase/DNA-binding winged helix-turn-helix (wHTH) protein
LIGLQNHGFDEVVIFGPFRLYPGQRRLEKSGERFSIGSRALDLLVALINDAGRVVDKRELMAKAWQNIVVDESNLRVNIAILRKALGEEENGGRYVANIPGRGYSFVGKVKRLHVTPTQEGKPDAARAHRALDTVVSSRPATMVGRDDQLCILTDAVVAHRCLTIVGSGGIGKSMLAKACADYLVEQFSSSVYWIDLDSVTDERLLLRTLMLRFGLDTRSSRPFEVLLEFLAGKRLTLVLDNCDHLLDCVAKVVETLYWNTSELHILATSREALRVEGEQVYRLGPLEVPAIGSGLTVMEARAYSAIELFIDKSQACGALLELDAEAIASIVEICARLDANPLAIGLVAGRVGAFGIKGILKLLDCSCRLHWTGRRNAIPRHQTLEASLDRCYWRLNEHEQRLLQRLAQLNGLFSLEQALLVSDAIPDYPLLIKTLDALVGKSLVDAELSSGGLMRYRLLETVRVYALERIGRGGRARSGVRIAPYTACALSRSLELASS